MTAVPSRPHPRAGAAADVAAAVAPAPRASSPRRSPARRVLRPDAPTTVATEERATLRLAGGEVSCTIRRSSRARRLRVTIDPRHGLLVTVPSSRGASLRTIESFLDERQAWLRRHLERQKAVLLAVASDGLIADGGTVPYLGEPHRIRVVAATPGARRSSVSRDGGDEGDELVVALAASERRAVARILEAWLRTRARSAIERSVARHAPELGVDPAAIAVRDQRTRWGSASRRGRLAFSWRLILAPPEVLESVVVHELAHLRVFGHGPGFWAVVATRCPDHRARRRWLRQHGVRLHAILSAPPEWLDSA